MLLTGIILLIFVAGIYLFLQGKPFGSGATGEQLARIQHSPNFRNGQFQNKNPTPSLTEGSNFFSVLYEFLFGGSKHKIPPVPLPSVKTNLLNLKPEQQILVWFGHSSYFMQVDGKTVLVDPVFSGNASPLFFTTKSFPGSDIYTPEDFPVIDYLFISHDHWDHLDFKTVIRLKTKVKRIITGLGTASHLEYWGFDKNIIAELDWNEELRLDDGFTVHTTAARHFSGRGLKRNGSLWMSFVFITPAKKIFLGGDSGYDGHFKEIGNAFGPFDLVILEDGQYDKNWKYIHMQPEETVQAAIDLKAAKLLPVHWAKFNLSVHAWNDPIVRIKKEADKRHVKLIHPMIGETVNLDQDETFDAWWERIA